MIAKIVILGLALATPSLGLRLPHIIGGTPVKDATKWPWQGSIREFGRHICGCALITPYWAVTAAHCIGSPIIFFLDVQFGSTTRDGTDGQRRYIKSAITHEDWGTGSGTFPNDIGVIQFENAFKLDDTVQTISLSSTDQAGNENCYITGWGYTSVSYSGELYRDLATDLQEAHVNVYTKKECTEEWGSTDINDGHVCVGDSENGRAACGGDSGGPLSCKVGGKWELVGVTSWGIGSCSPSYSTVYSRISYFKSWIEDKIKV